MNKQYVSNLQEGIERVKKVLYKSSDTNTVLFLSGGKTPKKLYEDLSFEKKLKAGAVAMIDERFGEKNHKNSNELMLRETGLLEYLNTHKIPFYSILPCHPGRSKTTDRILHKDSLQNDNSITVVTEAYDQIVHGLFAQFIKSIGILGIGLDGHTAGIPPKISNSKLQISNLVMDIDNFPGEQKERITLTFAAMEKLDLLIVLVFGNEKKKALGLAFSKGSEEEVPARFFTRPEIAQKTLLITDQKV